MSESSAAVSPAAPALGISVAFLAEKVAELESFKNIEELVREWVRPRTQAFGGVAFIDTLDEHERRHAGPATHMLSYPWQSSMVGDVIASLQKLCSDSGLSPEKTFVWIDSLCLSQHSPHLNRELEWDEFTELLENVIRQISHVLVLVSPWRDPKHLRRIWCVFEMFTAMKLDRRVTLLMPPDEVRQFSTTLTEDSYPCHEVARTVSSVDVERKTEATFRKDKKRILEAISRKVGSAQVFNREVRRHYLDCFLATAEAEWAAVSRSAVAPEHRKLTTLCCNVAKMLTECGDNHKSMAVLEEGRTLLAPTRTPETLFSLRILREMGTVQMKMNHADAITTLDRVRTMYMDLQAPAMDIAAVFNELGAARRKAGDLEGAMSACMSSRDALVDAGLRVAPITANVIGQIGFIEYLHGRLDKAAEAYEEALRIRAATKTKYAPAGALLFHSMGSLKEERGDLDGALLDYKLAESIRCNMGSLDTLPGALLVKSMADVWRKKAFLMKAQSMYLEARKIRERRGEELASTEDGRELSKAMMDVRKKGLKEHRALLTAAWEGDMEKVERALARKVQVHVDARGKDGETPLTLAAAAGRRAMVALLLERKADVLAVTTKGRTALWAAAHQDHREIVSCLLASRSPRDQLALEQEALLYSASHGDIENVRRMLQAHANVYHKTCTGKTALWMAGYKQHRDVVELLLERDALPDAESDGVPAGALPVVQAALAAHAQVPQ